ncbi:hypothetical protein LCGC14_0535500 [marine sediment metagenome]|uniref:Uncharacterized protein n=1 Tax=marine sediment metagenome TaxID=412755 RepID=A0A0F9UFS5_9ZZZZ
MGMTLTENTYPDCPNVQHKRVGDESYDICETNTKPCVIEHGLYECETYNLFLKEEGYEYNS